MTEDILNILLKSGKASISEDWDALYQDDLPIVVAPSTAELDEATGRLDAVGGYDTLKDTLTISAELINSVNANKANMLFMANQGYTTATDFADYLVKNKNLSFRESYAISAKLVNYAEKNKKMLSELNLEEIQKFYKDS